MPRTRQYGYPADARSDVPPIITLLSDFGAADYFVGAMKGVILGICPDATLVDISHDIPPQDVAAAAFTLRAASACFPSGTVHLAVVDPGVGSERRPIAISGAQRYVGPDNGIFTFHLDRDPAARVHRISDPALVRRPLSDTFHGRDLFAPVAAAIASGLPLEEVGPEVEDPVRLPLPRARSDGTHRIDGAVIHVDRFGNCVTNIERDPGVESSLAGEFTLEIGRARTRTLRRFYAEPVGERDGVFVIWGSAGLLEISVDRASAAALLGVGVGDRLVLRTGPGSPLREEGG
jgi:S-adenosyl-L-methionine hydrolase (adenosine-forming)